MTYNKSTLLCCTAGHVKGKIKFCIGKRHVDSVPLKLEEGRVLTVQSLMMLHKMATLLENLPLIIEGLVGENEFVFVRSFVFLYNKV